MAPSLDGIDNFVLPDAGLQFPLGFSVGDFASPIITLEVGPEATIMTAHKAILTKSVYFANCLKNFKEGVENKIKLADDRPADILRILCFLYTGKMFEGDTGDPCHDPDRHWTPQGVTDLISIYITADKYCVTGMLYRATAMMGCVRRVKSLNLSHLQQLADAGLGETPVSELTRHQIARNAIDDPKWLRIMLDKEVDLDPELGLKILKTMNAYMEEQKQRCSGSW
ncbi:hypothetical protein LTR99_009755 [Exophiala xenobiotica]|uniref:BTB domain-containing protein n=1 Tax=Vermiconidia calcicola TaxID=1690605 RepID=A0AAV9PW01_9PEZI|nr:hypothetical protein LTR96_007117 [Exophiala xenobiotica]KAK5530594.1 hypothetical protein LTR25_009172 [Vermiconidia calcicola]KAK5532181.1 hypothetical protein LTR23_009623 [Chaetothyriales sp. CCFEE 6169]KAK5294357.1 hypothetical protein LTR99_009755 [Exophiala xenobiotica]KAK5336250.1 hypothetical protein LTR98_007580 [Exophiala xenobiotica]